jgi:hypothetical protein
MRNYININLNMETRGEKIKAFNSFLSQTSPIVGIPYHFYFKKLIGSNAPLAIKYASYHMLTYKDQLMSQDEAYFHNTDNGLDTKINKVTGAVQKPTDTGLCDIMRLTDIYYKLDLESRQNVWYILQALL